MLARLAGTPLYVVHMSAKQAVDTVAAARDEGANVFGETCPQYLYLSLEEHLSAPGFEGAKYVCSTPLRAQGRGPPGRAVALPAHQRPVGGQHRPLPLLLQGAEGAGSGRLLQDPQRHRWRRAPHGPHLPGCRRRPHLAGPLGRAVRHHTGPHVRAVPPQGRARPGIRRRRRGLRPRRRARRSASRPTT